MEIGMSNELETLTRTIIQTKVLEELKKGEVYIDTLVRAVFEDEVDQYGGKPNYGSQKMPWLTWAVRDAMQTAARAAVIEHVKTLEPQINTAVIKAMSADEIVAAFTKKITGSMRKDYSITVKFDKVDD